MTASGIFPIMARSLPSAGGPDNPPIKSGESHDEGGDVSRLAYCWAFPMGSTAKAAHSTPAREKS
jgi:hypothetical protein